MTTYIGPPEECDLCGDNITTAFVDGRMKLGGSWANMCIRCYEEHGAGLGLGLGQHYELAADGNYHKTKG
jgi:hypothetical protein